MPVVPHTRSPNRAAGRVAKCSSAAFASRRFTQLPYNVGGSCCRSVRQRGSEALLPFAHDSRRARSRAAKLSEETFELCVELGRAQRAPRRIAEEAADLTYHLLVALVEADVALAEVLGILEERRR